MCIPSRTILPLNLPYPQLIVKVICLKMQNKQALASTYNSNLRKKAVSLPSVMEPTDHECLFCLRWLDSLSTLYPKLYGSPTSRPHFSIWQLLSAAFHQHSCLRPRCNPGLLELALLSISCYRPQLLTVNLASKMWIVDSADFTNQHHRWF